MTYPTVLDMWVTRTGRDQPALLPHALALNDCDEWIKKRNPPVFFLGFNMLDTIKMYRDNHAQMLNTHNKEDWGINAVILRDLDDYPDKISPLLFDGNGKGVHQRLFWQVTEEEKNRIMRSLSDDMLFAGMYSSPDLTDTFLAYRPGLPKDLPVCKPRLVTTKPVLLPHKMGRDYWRNREDIEDYLHQDITPLVFQSDYFNEENMYQMENFAARDGHVFYPTQFIAVHWQGWQDIKSGKMLFNEPQAMNGKTQKQCEIALRNQYRATEAWVVSYVTPFGTKPVSVFQKDLHEHMQYQKTPPEDRWHKPPFTSSSADTLRKAVTFLQQAEQHFIDPFYKTDPVLARLQDNLAISPDFWPTHYSKIDERHYRSCDNALFPN